MGNSSLEENAENMYLGDIYGDFFIEDIQHGENFHRVLDLIKESGASSILDCGYGTGAIATKLAALPSSVSIDIIEGSDLLCKQAKERFGHRICIINSFFEFYEPNKKYDVILALHVLEHVEESVNLLRKFHSWLNPGGIVIAAVPNANSIHRKLAVMLNLQPCLEHLSQRDIAVSHKRVYMPSQLESEFKQAGFDINEISGYFLKIVPNSMMLNWSPELISALTKVSDQIPSELLANIFLVAKK
ncbi:class I SAM-dependent methyltransferase [Pectobacterium versatile]|uniref:class I SAM-dependent methyltransferase n=1 Tax=Pectobacterium versatile TaxID=2488639 RepID=UPI001935B32C|nr:class I SAM-dependent methyltransferase [Pectobacterium versatile]MCO4312575.1 class I SAM-dependent methyltransferase [Pectobacterium versatile]QQK71761.1 class I SAM-dependent methyltransferase [Pectobacterium versatile]